MSATKIVPRKFGISFFSMLLADTTLKNLTEQCHNVLLCLHIPSHEILRVTHENSMHGIILSYYLSLHFEPGTC
jgi:hypothetical protein